MWGHICVPVYEWVSGLNGELLHTHCKFSSIPLFSLPYTSMLHWVLSLLQSTCRLLTQFVYSHHLSCYLAEAHDLSTTWLKPPPPSLGPQQIPPSQLSILILNPYSPFSTQSQSELLKCKCDHPINLLNILQLTRIK